MSIDCKIEFKNNPSKVVQTGELIQIELDLVMRESLLLSNVRLEVYGVEHIFPLIATDRRPPKIIFSKQMDIFNDDDYIAAGIYKRNFECQLDHPMPSSFEGLYGYVRYAVRVVFEMDRGNCSRFEIPFKVIKMIDLDDIPTSHEQVTSYSDNMFGRLSTKCYVPGQTINVELVGVKKEKPIFCRSFITVPEYTVQLIRETDYYNVERMRSKCERKILMEECTFGYKIGNTRFISAHVIVPSTPPTEITNASFIKHQYYIRIIGQSKCFFPGPVMELPIIIGSPSKALANGMTENRQTIYHTISSRTLDAQSDADPPTYEEAMQFERS